MNRQGNLLPGGKSLEVQVEATLEILRLTPRAGFRVGVSGITSQLDLPATRAALGPTHGHACLWKHGGMRMKNFREDIVAFGR